MRERAQPSLLETISLTYAYYNQGQSLPDAVLLMYAEDLHHLDPAACILAYGQWRRNPANKKFPLPAEICELVNPEQFVAVETRAREIAARIIGSITKFGWSNAKEAQVFIGPEGWACVLRNGGWRHLCENTQTRQAPMMQAQFRDQLEGQLRYGAQVIEQSIGALSAREARGELESAADIAQRLLSAPIDTSRQGPEGEGAV